MALDPQPALEPGLYIVATPIGNLGDVSARAVAVLRGVAAVACEDSRVTGKLLHHLGIKQRMIRYDDHVDGSTRERLVAMAASEPLALVCDAGTPLISDPGYRLVRSARAAGVMVTSLPGPSAAVVALTLAGLPTDRFLFAGFLPSKAVARAATLSGLASVPATLVFYESGPRLVAALGAIALALPGREVAVARELTKLHEECRTGSAEELVEHYTAHPPRGEIVLLVGPPSDDVPVLSEADADSLLIEALANEKPSQAASRLAREHGLDRKTLYARALELREK